tara:strand:- start:3157 stop:5550 length:2394 start_codon:yes stop_codon:yes gene_type:complete
MAIIYSYPAESSPQPGDLILGTSTATVDGKQTNVTRTYTMQTITDYIKTLGGIGVESITFSAPLTGGTITQTGTVSIPQASSAADGYLSSGDWTTFNNKLGGISGVQYKIPIWSTTAALGNSSLTETGGGTTITSAKTFAPSADATYDLGVTGTGRWRNMFLSGTANAVDFSGTNLTITGTLSANGSTGTSGYILQSKGASAVEWVDLSSAYDTYDINVTTQGSDVDLNLTSTSGTDNSKVQITAGSGIVLTRNAAQQMTIARTADTYQGTVDEIDVNPTGAAFLTVTNGAPSSPSGKVTLNPQVGTVAAGQTGLVSGDAVNTAIQAALTGFVEFKGGFRADSGLITSGANAGSYLYNCPGGAGTRIAIAVGDYYVVETQGGDFYCDAAHTLTIGDQVICSTAAGADSSVLSNWTQIQENIDLATATTPGIANYPAGIDQLNITAGAVSAKTYSGTGTSGYVPTSVGGDAGKFLRQDGTWQDGPASGVADITFNTGLTGGTISAGGSTVTVDYTTANNVVLSAADGTSDTLADADDFIFSVGNNVKYGNLSQLKTYIGAGSGTVTGSGTTNTLPKFTSSTAIGDSNIADTGTLVTVTGDAKVTGNLELDGDLLDVNGSAGVAGQVLSSLGGSGAGVDWIPAPVGYTDWKLDGDSGTQQDITDGSAVGFKGGTEAGGAGIVTEANQPAGKNITISLVNTGGTASASTFYRGDGQWAAAGGLPTRTVMNFTGDGSDTGSTGTFTLTPTPSSTAYTDVYISGVYQQKNSYSLAGGSSNELLFSTAPPVTATNGIEVVITT